MAQQVPRTNSELIIESPSLICSPGFNALAKNLATSVLVALFWLLPKAAAAQQAFVPASLYLIFISKQFSEISEKSIKK